MTQADVARENENPFNLLMESVSARPDADLHSRFPPLLCDSFLPWK